MTTPVARPVRSRAQDWLLRAALALASGGPTVLWAASGGDLLTDDWVIAADVRFRGFWAALDLMAWTAPGRPLAALVLSVQYLIIGSHPLPSLLLLAGLNVAAALLVLAVAQRVLPRREAALVALVWAVLPNRGSTRLWSIMLPAMLALVLLLVAALWLTRADGGRPMLAGVFLALATLAYEAVALVGIALVAYWAWPQARHRSRTAAAAMVLPVSSAALVYLQSPKRVEGVAPPFTNATRLFAANFGSATLGETAAALGATLVLVRVVLALVRATFPSFKPPCVPDRMALAGVVLFALGALPFMAAGFPFATDGIFDRGNLAASFGTAAILASSLTALLSERYLLVGGTVMAALLAWMLALNGRDLRDYRASVRDGRELVAQLDHDLPIIPAGGVLVVPPLPNRGGVAMFILEGDLNRHLQLDRDLGAPPDIRVALEGEDERSAPEIYRYDRLTSSLTAIR